VKRSCTYIGEVACLKKSVSREAESAHEQTHEGSRKKTSVVKASKPKSSDSFTRADQHATVVGPNVGSNRNNPDRVVSNRERVGNIVVEAHGVSNPDTTPEQFERSHEDVDSDSKAGGRKPREVKESSAAERRVQGEPGFVEAGRRSAAVQSRRRETERSSQIAGRSHRAYNQIQSGPLLCEASAYRVNSNSQNFLACSRAAVPKRSA